MLIISFLGKIIYYFNSDLDVPNDKLAALLPSSDKEVKLLDAIVQAGMVL